LRGDIVNHEIDVEGHQAAPHERAAEH
jgi:hypothetical protein